MKKVTKLTHIKIINIVLSVSFSHQTHRNRPGSFWLFNLSWCQLLKRKKYILNHIFVRNFCTSHWLAHLKIVIHKTCNNNTFDERMDLFYTSYRISQINSIIKSFILFYLIILQIKFTNIYTELYSYCFLFIYIHLLSTVVVKLLVSD